MKLNHAVKMAILDKIKTIIKASAKRLSPAYGKDVSYSIGRLKINLPYGHLLPVYQAECPQYDRFLPHFAKYLPKDSFVIDVGANCADTLAGMIDANPSLNFLCIEADDFFYKYLSLNVNKIKKTYGKSSIKLVRCLAGSEVSNVKMIGSGGTKKAVVFEGDQSQSISSKSLDCIVHEERIDQAAISLVKVDTDGYDYDVINSAGSLLDNQLPILFFECQYDEERQKKNYETLITELEKRGYTNWTVFDNFGGLLLRCGSKENILDLIHYVWYQNAGKSRRTFYYLDILASSLRDVRIISDALDHY